MHFFLGALRVKIANGGDRMASSVNPNQTAPSGTGLSGFSPFSLAYLSLYLDKINILKNMNISLSYLTNRLKQKVQTMTRQLLQDSS